MLAPTPKSIRWADICRDGGSYVLVYCDVLGAEHELELRVVLSRDGQYQRVGYNTPTICNYNQEGLGDPLALSWHEAEILAGQLAPLAIEPDEHGINRAAECIQFMRLEGRLS